MFAFSVDGCRFNQCKRLLPREERLFTRIRGHVMHPSVRHKAVLQPIATVLDTLVAQHYLSRTGFDHSFLRLRWRCHFKRCDGDVDS
jgi:hypothetical protein